jgi:hypothetical protein
MSKWFTFPSLARPTWRYRLYVKDSDNPSYNFRNMRSGIDSHLSQFDTMGHGEVQHSPDVQVATEDTYDVIMSLGCVLNKIEINLNDETQCGSAVLKWFWRCDSSASQKEIDFALTLKWIDNKRQWYTFTDNGPRKSTSEAKKHDRRWIEVPSFSESDSAIGRVLTIIGTDETKCRPQGIINHIATVIAIAKTIEPDGWQHYAIKELMGNGGAFANKDRYQMLEMLNVYERISTFKRAVSDLRYARDAAEHQMERELEKRALQPA